MEAIKNEVFTHIQGGTGINKKDGGPVYPSQQEETSSGEWNQTYESGMSLRDHFAGLAMQGLIIARSHEFEQTGNTRGWPTNLEKDAWILVAAMLKARES